MHIKPVSEVLALAGLHEPLLNTLVPNEENYKVLLMQPRGEIEASDAGVRNRDRVLAKRQFGSFLDDARQTQADLVITPEYLMPWDALAGAIKAGLVPAVGKLWALGCESITYSGLETLKQDLAPFATVLFEMLDANERRFVSPLAYVFKASFAAGKGDLATVILVQFKTHPMGDPNHFEIAGMQRGTCVYQFGGEVRSLRLVSLICADAFAFEDSHARSIHDRALILHIQLNREPRHERFLGCRQRLLSFSGDVTEVVCLNWARDLDIWSGGNEVNWQNISGSAWYLKSKDFDDRDSTLTLNHRRGLYYTWLQSLHSHALFFNFEPATFLLEVTKVAHVGVNGAMSRRRGPQLIRTFIWDGATGTWKNQESADDGFSVVVGESGNAMGEIKRIADRNPFEAERILALCAGKIENRIDWHKLSRLDSCIIEASEVIRRLTYCQDTDPVARDFRIARLRRLGHLWRILQSEDHLPPALSDFRGGFQLEWSPDFPHQNIVSNRGQRATVVYMGEDSGSRRAEAVFKYTAEFLHRASSNPDESHTARQRLAVWYVGDGGELERYGLDRFIKFDTSGDTSEFDIGREA